MERADKRRMEELRKETGERENLTTNLVRVSRGSWLERESHEEVGERESHEEAGERESLMRKLVRERESHEEVGERESLMRKLVRESLMRKLVRSGLKWAGRLTKSVGALRVDSRRKGRPRLRWEDFVKRFGWSREWRMRARDGGVETAVKRDQKRKKENKC